jgi:VEFS-Box of polycomb protein
MSRTFYHSITGEPFKLSDCPEDSEDEVDDTWVMENEEKHIDELGNVNTAEKKFMKLWNRHIYETGTVSILIKQACISFVNKYHDEIHSMQDQWSLHLVTLLEYHALTGDDLLYLQLLLNSTLKKSSKQ